MLGNNEVYMVQIKFSNTDNEGSETYLFYKKEKALEVMKQIIENEKINIYENQFDDNGKLIDNDYVIDTNINEQNCFTYWWNIECKTDFYIYTFIDLKPIQIES